MPPVKRIGIALGAFLALSLLAYTRILNGWFLSDDNMIGIRFHGSGSE